MIYRDAFLLYRDGLTGSMNGATKWVRAYSELNAQYTLHIHRPDHPVVLQLPS
jgi:hypothetical protein